MHVQGVKQSVLSVRHKKLPDPEMRCRCHTIPVSGTWEDIYFAFYTHEKCMPFDYTQLCWASPKMDNYLYSSHIPYSLDQMLLLLLISSPDFVRHSRVATNWERRSFISVNSSLVPRQLPPFQCTGIRSLGDIEEDKDELQRTNLFLMTANCILSTWALQATPHSRYYYAILCIAIES